MYGMLYSIKSFVARMSPAESYPYSLSLTYNMLIIDYTISSPPIR